MHNRAVLRIFEPIFSTELEHRTQQVAGIQFGVDEWLTLENIKCQRNQVAQPNMLANQHTHIARR